MTLLSYRCNTNDIQLCNEIFIDNHVLQKRNVYAGWNEPARPNAWKLQMKLNAMILTLIRIKIKR